jgi:hypothetical protein
LYKRADLQQSVFLKTPQSNTYISYTQKQTGMPDTDCPPAWEILSYLFCIILSVAMIWYIHLAVNFWNIGAVPLYAIFSFIWFCIIIWYAAVHLVLLLLPARKDTCPVCCLLAKIIEVD